MGTRPEEVPLSVVEAVADTLDRPIEQLPPLWQAVDPDALNALLSDTDGGVKWVVLEYSGCDVTVYEDGQVDVE